MLRVLFLIVSLLSFSSHSRADIYRFVDKDGVAHFTNVPIDARFEALGWEEEFDHYIGKYDSVIQMAAAKYGVEAALIKAVIKAESNFDPSAVSRKGAIGLMQLMPATAADLKVSDPYNPRQNIEGGTRYLRYLTGLFDKDLRLVIAAYNAGENAVIRYGRGIPPYRETRDYVNRVIKYLASYRREASIPNRLARK
jgi:soluble lytic murein transglycosylase